MDATCKPCSHPASLPPENLGTPGLGQASPPRSLHPPTRVATDSMPRARRQRKAAPEPTLSPQGHSTSTMMLPCFPWLRRQRHQTSRQTQPPPRRSLFRNRGPDAGCDVAPHRALVPAGGPGAGGGPLSSRPPLRRSPRLRSPGSCHTCVSGNEEKPGGMARLQT